MTQELSKQALRFPGDPSCAFAPVYDPGRTDAPSPGRSHRCCPCQQEGKGFSVTSISGLPRGFSAWGVIAMWAIFAVAFLAALRRRLRPRTWRIAHSLLAVVTVVGSVVHAILIEGTMETVSKAALCVLVLAGTIKVMADLRVWRKRATARSELPSGDK